MLQKCLIIALLLITKQLYAQKNIVAILDSLARESAQVKKENKKLQEIYQNEVKKLKDELDILEKKNSTYTNNKEEMERLRDKIKTNEQTIVALKTAIEQSELRVKERDVTINAQKQAIDAQKQAIDAQKQAIDAQKQAIAIINEANSNKKIGGSMTLLFIASTKTYPYKYGDRINVPIKGLARIEVSFQGTNTDNRQGTFGFETKTNQNCMMPPEKIFTLKSGILDNNGKIVIELGALKDGCKGDQILVMDIPESDFSLRIPITLQ